VHPGGALHIYLQIIIMPTLRVLLLREQEWIKFFQQQDSFGLCNKTLIPDINGRNNMHSINS
jgi:hypothetical protein